MDLRIFSQLIFNVVVYIPFDYPKNGQMIQIKINYSSYYRINLFHDGLQHSYNDIIFSSTNCVITY